MKCPALPDSFTWRFGDTTPSQNFGNGFNINGGLWHQNRHGRLH